MALGPGVAGGLDEGVEDVDALSGGGGDVAADRGEVFGAGQRSHPAGDLDADSRCRGIEGANQDVAAATKYEIYVKVAQLDLPITAALEVWDALPATPPVGPPWQLVKRFELPFSSGLVLLGDGGGQSIYGPWLPLGPGLYIAEVWSTGRSHAVQRAARVPPRSTPQPRA